MAYRMSDDLEIVILTGGQSRRMGIDKASMLVDGEPVADRIVRLCSQAGFVVTVIGRTPITGAGFLGDQKDFMGPLHALRAFQPEQGLVCLFSCDLPRFEVRIIEVLCSLISETDDACVPEIDGQIQPLLGVYRKDAFAKVAEVVSAGGRSLKSWLDTLSVSAVDEHVLVGSGLDLDWLMSANTPEEWAQALEQRAP